MAALSKADYLKRYMSKSELSKEDGDKKKKRRKIKPSKDSNFRIIDDDLDLKKLNKSQEIENEEEYQPTVAEIVDERPKHVQDLEAYRKSSKWKTVADEDNNDEGIDSLGYGLIKTGVATVVSAQRKRHDSSGSDTTGSHEKISNSKSKRQSNGRKRHDSDSDDSDKPPSKKKPNSAKAHNMNNRHDSDSDQSPPRTHKSSLEKIRDDSDVDQSPHRKRLDSGSDQSPQRNRNESDSDQSLPRNRKDYDSDQSPPRNRNDSDSDQSPPRKKKAPGSHQSPPRRGKNSKDTDLSPPRRMKDSESDQSPPRKRKASDSDQSPPRRGKIKNNKDLSPPRKASRDRKSRFHSPERKNKDKATKTLGGAKAGLSSAKEMREEALKLKAREDKKFNAVDEETLGKNATTVMRDKETGKRRNIQAEEAAEKEEQKKRAELEQKYKLWGRGMKQQQNYEATLADQVHEASKPLARYQDDKDLDTMQRQEERAEDPMLAFIQKKKSKEESKKGPKKKKKELPKYNGRVPPPPNRFNIMPGYRWDGVDRSNGFEKKIYAAQANRKAISEMAYKWSTEDM